MSEQVSRLVYSTDSSGKIWERPVYSDRVIGEVRPEDRDIGEAAVTLGDELGTRYSRELSWLLDDGLVAGNPSDRVREFLANKRMDQPRVAVYSSEAFEPQLDKQMAAFGLGQRAINLAWDDWTRDPDGQRLPESIYEPYIDVERSAPGSFVVNFQLPKPLDIFWSKQDESGPISWGALYRRMADVPWNVVHEWEQKYGNDFSVRRLNPIGVHENGDDGFYYLFEVSRNDV